MREATLTSSTGVGNAAVVWGSLSQGCLCAEHLKQAGDSAIPQHSSFVQSSDCSLAMQAPLKPNSCISPCCKQSLLHLFPHLFLLLHKLWSQASELKYSGLAKA